MDVIEISGLRLRCVIGCREEERRDRSDVVIDLRIDVDARPAAASDDLEDAWNYRTATKAVIAYVEASEHRTVEALTDAVARILVLDRRTARVQVRVSKPGALRFADTVGLTIERTADDFREQVAIGAGGGL